MSWNSVGDPKQISAMYGRCFGHIFLRSVNFGVGEIDVKTWSQASNTS